VVCLMDINGAPTTVTQGRRLLPLGWRDAHRRGTPWAVLPAPRTGPRCMQLPWVFGSTEGAQLPAAPRAAVGSTTSRCGSRRSCNRRRPRAACSRLASCPWSPLGARAAACTRMRRVLCFGNSSPVMAGPGSGGVRAASASAICSICRAAISSPPCDSDNLATPCRKLVAPWPPPWGICECPLPPPMPLPSSPAAFVSCFSLPEERDQEGAVSSAECGAWSAGALAADGADGTPVGTPAPAGGTAPAPLCAVRCGSPRMLSS
jgi:hypothetical protein